MSSRMKSQQLSSAIMYRAGQAGSITRLAKALNIDPGYLSNLANGHKDNPSKEIMDKLGIVEVRSYHLLDPGDVDLHYEMRKIIEANRIAGERS